MLRRIDIRGDAVDLASALPNSVSSGAAPEVLESVRSIISDVCERGDAALLEYTQRFDGVSLESVAVSPDLVKAAWEATSPELQGALSFAADQIRGYHEAQVSDVEHAAWGADGISVAEMIRPVERAGLYVPGGRGAYPSTVLMTAIPAAVAGVDQIILCVPPAADGSLPQATLAAAALCEIDEIYSVGGAQAIAAMAYGTESIKAVDVIVGPGNQYVSLAKGEVSGDVGIDSMAGPSELVVIADESTPAEFIALDLMAQAEHGPDGTAVVISWSEEVLEAVNSALSRLVKDAPRRKDIESNFANGGASVLVSDWEQAIEVSNFIAPEHLELCVANPEELLKSVNCAGAVFCGPWAPAVVGDYISGANHVLPTGRSARFASALRVDTFRKHIHVVRVERSGLERVAPFVAALTEAEELFAHGEAVARRVTQ